MSVNDDDNKVLIFGFPEDLRLKIFKLLSTFSWTYVCSNTIRDFRRIDGEFKFKLAIFYVSKNSHQTFSFISDYMDRNLENLHCPTIAITKEHDDLKKLVYQAIFKHVFHVDKLEGEITQLIRFYYSQVKQEDSVPEINLFPNAITQASGEWIDSLSIELRAKVNFLKITNIKVTGSLIDELQINNCRFAAYPDKNHKDNLLKIRIDGLSKESAKAINTIATKEKNQRLSILSLDDDEELCFLLKRKFEKFERFEYEYATSIQSFFKKIEEKRFDMYLIDYNLGEENFKGLEVVKFLRDKFGESVLVFMLSKADHKENLPNYFEYGFNDYFYKPIDIKQVVAKLNYFLPPQLNDSGITLKEVPQEHRALSLRIKVELISFNQHNCIIKTNFSINLGEELTLDSFLEDNLHVKIRIVELVDKASNYNLYKVQYIQPRMGLITKIRQIKSNDKEII